jgi:hypothetical protein
MVLKLEGTACFWCIRCHILIRSYFRVLGMAGSKLHKASREHSIHRKETKGSRLRKDLILVLGWTRCEADMMDDRLKRSKLHTGSSCLNRFVKFFTENFELRC